MQMLPYPRLTPWVMRLIIANAVVLLLMLTLFTSPAVEAALAFSPAGALARPWTFLTYMFVHGGLLHLVSNMFGLFIFGAAVEHRMGSRAFLAYYLFCGVGAALFTLALSSFLPIAPFVGASGAILGITVAFAMYWPDAEVILFPIPIPMKARTLALLIVGSQVLAMVVVRGTSIAYEAHVGGALMGYLFFRLQQFSAERPEPRPRPVERVTVGSSAPASGERRERQAAPATAAQPRVRRGAEPDTAGDEMNRVLDKISATGLESLTPAERRFLDDIAKKKRGE